jgi:cytoskeletal protein CcmA (bactofilin family)
MQSMLKKKEKTTMRKESGAEKGEIKAFLGAGSQFEGTLVFDEIVRMDGMFSGRITSKDTLIVGETAQIEADVTVGTLILSGRFKGTIIASKKVELRAPAELEGTIEAPSLAVEEGVVLNSTISMRKDLPKDNPKVISAISQKETQSP